ncbi:MAG: hypothetical protein WC956_10200 [bacterium]
MTRIYTVSQIAGSESLAAPSLAADTATDEDMYAEVGPAEAAVSFLNDSAALHRWAAIFDAAPAVSGDEIAEILRSTPPIQCLDGSDRYGIEADPASSEAYLSGRLRYPSLEALHMLLSSKKGARNTLAIDNAPGPYPHLAAVVAALGSRVLVKEPSSSYIVHASHVFLDLPEDVAARIFYAGAGLAGVNVRTPADIVYWTNPTPAMQSGGRVQRLPIDYRDLRHDHNVGSYMGRDVVAPGGYLVVQTDAEELQHLYLDPSKWVTVFSSMLTEEEGFQGPIIPTHHYRFPNKLSIHMRRNG